MRYTIFGAKMSARTENPVASVSVELFATDDRSHFKRVLALLGIAWADGEMKAQKAAVIAIPMGYVGPADDATSLRENGVRRGSKLFSALTDKRRDYVGLAIAAGR